MDASFNLEKHDIKVKTIHRNLNAARFYQQAIRHTMNFLIHDMPGAGVGCLSITRWTSAPKPLPW